MVDQPTATVPFPVMVLMVWGGGASSTPALKAPLVLNKRSQPNEEKTCSFKLVQPVVVSELASPYVVDVISRGELPDGVAVLQVMPCTEVRRCKLDLGLKATGLEV